MKKRHALLVLLALTLAVLTALPPALAYFTANARASGGRTVQLGRKTEITEEFADWKKTVRIAANAVTRPCYVRVRAYSIADVPLTYGGAGWTDGGDGWWYCDTPIANGGEGAQDPAWTTQETAPLVIEIHIKNVAPEQLPEELDVPVVYETTPVTYRADGSRVGPLESDWSPALTVRGKEDAA